MDVKGKVALVTGGAAGIGLSCCEELLKHGAKVAICDIDGDAGEQVADELAAKHGKKSVLFFQCDVTDYMQFEESFQVTIRELGGLDIVINNAGVMNDRFWELEVDVNLNGVIRGTLLAYRFMGRDRGAHGGIVVNMAGTACIKPQISTPIYTATQYAIVGLTKSYGDAYHVGLTGVKTIALCPSVTDTSLVKDIRKQLMSSEYETAWEKDNANSKVQSPAHVGKSLIEVLSKAKSGSVWVVENSQSPKEQH